MRQQLRQRIFFTPAATTRTAHLLQAAPRHAAVGLQIWNSQLQLLSAQHARTSDPSADVGNLPTIIESFYINLPLTNPDLQSFGIYTHSTDST